MGRVDDAARDWRYEDLVELPKLRVPPAVRELIQEAAAAREVMPGHRQATTTDWLRQVILAALRKEIKP